jgi:protease I
MDKKLNNLKVAILVENGFEQVELTEPKKALEAAGATAKIVSPVKGKVKGWQHTQWGDEFPVDVALDQARSEDFDALLLPGGVINPDKLRITPRAIAFIKEFFDAGKPVAAICHGPWTLIDAGQAKGRTLTSWPSIKTDLINAGAQWVDREVVNEKGLVTSRKPDDIPAFNREMITLFSEQAHQQTQSAKRTR